MTNENNKSRKLKSLKSYTVGYVNLFCKCNIRTSI